MRPPVIRKLEALRPELVSIGLWGVASVIYWIVLGRWNGIPLGSSDGAVLAAWTALLHLPFFLPAWIVGFVLSRSGRPRVARPHLAVAAIALAPLIVLDTLLRFPATYAPLTEGRPMLSLSTTGGALAALSVGLAILLSTVATRRRALGLGLGAFVLWGLNYMVQSTTETDHPPDLGWIEALRSGSPQTGQPERVVLVAIDGMSWDVVRVLSQAGELPVLTGLLRKGAAATVRTLEPSRSPSIWTTVATGVLPVDHGIRGFTRLRPAGMKRWLDTGPPLSFMNWWHGLNRVLVRATRQGWVEQVPVTSVQRERLAIWELADQAGLSTGVFRWWAGAPYAPPTSKAFRVSELPEQERGLFPEATILPRIRESAHRVGFEPMERLHMLPMQVEKEEEWLRLATGLTHEYRPTLTLLYSRYLDRTQHHHWAETRDVEGHRIHEASQLPLSIREAYRSADQWIGQIVDLDPDALTLVLSDHGFRFDGHQHHRAPFGTLIAAGPGVRPGTLEIGIEDLFPLMASALGLPLAEDLSGRVPSDLFLPGVLEPSLRVQTYPRPEVLTPAADDQADFEAQLDNLRTLGYVN